MSVFNQTVLGGIDSIDQEEDTEEELIAHEVRQPAQRQEDKPCYCQFDLIFRCTVSAIDQPKCKFYEKASQEKRCLFCAPGIGNLCDRIEAHREVKP